jgi:DNA mismatch repair protein MutS
MQTTASRDRRPTAEEPDAISLLWPGGGRPKAGVGRRLTAEAANDLGLAEVIQTLAGAEGRSFRREQRERFAREVLAELCTDPSVIAYRQAVVADLLDDPPLRERLAQTLPGLDALSEAVSASRYRPADEGGVQRIARRLADLELFVEVARELDEALAAVPLRAAALRALCDYVHAVTRSPTFLALQAELPALRATLAEARSVTVGINLTPELVPESATILGVSSERVEGRRALLGRLLGGRDASRGITPLQRGGTAGADGLAGRPNRLVRDLNKLLEEIAAPVADALDRYASLPPAALAGVGLELALLLNGALLVEHLERAGLPTCRPEILPLDERQSELCDAYNIGLALRLNPPNEAPAGLPDRGDVPSAIVTNAASFDRTRGRVWILTGPNRGGKTTYTRAVGLAHVLSQAGLYVPAQSARLSPVDAIYTHFPSRERAQLGMGRLDEEAERLADIFQRATPHSLILLNEALASTGAIEAFGLARGAVRGLRLLGARAIYVTHLHELATVVDEINATTPGDGTVGSLIAEAGDEEQDSTGGPGRTFRIRPGVPRGKSFASEIAEQRGISFPQLAQLLRQRGIPAALADVGEAE